MKLFFRIIFKVFFIITILAGCVTNVEIKETDLDVLLNQGTALFEEGKYDLSINYFNKAIEINPGYAMAYYNRGTAYQGKGQFDKAISDYNRAIEINPRYADAYNNQGLAYFFKKEYEKAWDNVHKLQNLGDTVHPNFLRVLRQASGRQK